MLLSLTLSRFASNSFLSKDFARKIIHLTKVRKRAKSLGEQRNLPRHAPPKYVPPPKYVFRKPKLHTTLRRCRMTIAVGLLAQGGAVIAADREESDGVQKSDQSKIGGAWVGGRGCLAITGAGNGPYLDSLSDTLVDWFRDTNSDFKADAFAEDLRRKHYEFYKRCVLPFAPYEESVDYELLACFDPAPTRREIALAAEFGGIPGKRPALWTSHKLTLLKAEPFAAVGCGAVTAKALLTKFWGFVDATGGCN